MNTPAYILHNSADRVITLAYILHNSADSVINIANILHNSADGVINLAYILHNSAGRVINLAYILHNSADRVINLAYILHNSADRVINLFKGLRSKFIHLYISQRRLIQTKKQSVNRNRGERRSTLNNCRRSSLTLHTEWPTGERKVYVYCSAIMTSPS